MSRILTALLIILMLVMVTGAAFAYRLVLIPTGNVLPEGMYKLEFSGPYNDNLLNEWLPAYRLDTTVYKGFEIGIKSGCVPGTARANNTQVSMHWQVMPEKDGMPGFGMGVWNWYDSQDRDDRKNSLFAAAFKTVKMEEMKYPIQVHFGGGTKQLRGVFGGVAVPLSKRFSVAAEYCPKGLRTPGTNSGLVLAAGYNQTPNWRFKYANAGGDHAIGVVYTNWFNKQ